MPRGIGTCGTNGRPQRGWGTNVTTDLDLQAHRRMTILVVVMVMIACITRSRINQWSTLISTVFENRPKKSHSTFLPAKRATFTVLPDRSILIGIKLKNSSERF